MATPDDPIVGILQSDDLIYIWRNGARMWSSVPTFVQTMPAGPTGATGPAGSQGVKGDTGNTGQSGATGAQGVAGEQGLTGSQGIQGATGPAGVSAPIMRCGSVSFSNALTKDVTFTSPMPDTNYQIICFAQSTLAVAITLFPSNKTVSGFTINALALLTATIGYLAVANT